MNSIILIAACAVCLDQLFFRRRLASYVVDNLKGPKKKHTGHDAAPHTPKAGSLARQTPEILVSKSYRCGLERTGADWSGLERTSAPPRQAEMLYLPRLRKRSPRCRGGTPLSCGPRSAKTANSRSPKRPPAPDSRFRLSPPEQNSAMRKFMRCSESWTSENAPLWAMPRPRSGRPLPTSTSGPLPDT